MNFIQFAKDMLALGTIPAYASLLCIGIFAFYVIWHALRGFHRGIFKQLFHTAFAVISIVISFTVAGKLWVSSLNVLDGHTVEEFFTKWNLPISENIIDALCSFDIQVVEYILLLPIGVVVMPIIFMALFFVINFVFRAVYFMTVGILRIKVGGFITTKGLGLVLGMVEGAIVASVILLPVAGISNICDDAYVMITEANEKHGFEETKAEKLFCEYIKPFSSNPALDMIDKLGSELLLDKLASFEDGDVELNMRDEFASMVRFAFVDIAGLKDTDWLALNETDKKIVDDVVSFVSESDYKASVVSEMLNSMGQLVGALNASSPDEQSRADIILELFSIFEGLDRDNLGSVLTTFKDFYFLVSDEGILKGFATGDRTAITSAFTKTDESGATVLARMTKILESNESTAVLVKSITKMTITVLCDSQGIDSDAVAKYNGVKDSLNSTLSALDPEKTKEEKVADVSAALTESFAQNGMNVEPNAVDGMAEYVIDNYGEKGEITEDDFNDIMLNYYQSSQTNTEVSPE